MPTPPPTGNGALKLSEGQFQLWAADLRGDWSD